MTDQSESILSIYRRGALQSVAAAVASAAGGAMVGVSNATGSSTELTTGEMIEVPANPDDGYHYPYLIYVPESALNGSRRLLVEPNNTGQTSDDFGTHRDRAERRLQERGRTRRLCNELDIPAIVPIFPRPRSEPVDWTHYTHALDRQTLEIDDGPLERIDEQLIAMADDARTRLTTDLDIDVPEAFLMNGFSATGNFVNRFTAIHPERVRASIAGGINGTVLLPRSEVGGRRVDYHVGVEDLEELVGEPFDLDAWQNVDQFIYLGADDDNDTIPFDDAWTSDERRQLALDIYGQHMQEERMPTGRKIYEEAGFTGWYRTYPNVGHSFVMDEMEAFLRRHTETVSVRFDRPLGIGDDLVTVDVTAWADEEPYEIHVFDADGNDLTAAPDSFDPGTISVESIALTRDVMAGEDVTVAAVDPADPTLNGAVATDTTSVTGAVEIVTDPVAGDRELTVSYELDDAFNPDGLVEVRVETEEGGAQRLTTVAPGDSDTVTAELDIDGLGVPFIQDREVRVAIVDDDPEGFAPLAVDSTSIGQSEEPIADLAEFDIPPAVEAGDLFDVSITTFGIGGPEEGETSVQISVDGEESDQITVPVEVGARENTEFSISASADPGETDVTITIDDRSYTKTFLVAEHPQYGNGTVADPYEVSSGSELAFAITRPSRHFALTDDIDLDAYSTFQRIGTRDDPFTGSLDGRGHRITGLALEGEPEDFEGLGLFGNAVADAHIHDVHVENAMVDGTGGTFVGIIAGFTTSDALIERVTTSGEVVGDRHVGGIVGGTSSGGDFKVVEATSTATVNAVNNTSGGIIGQLSGHTVERCSFTGELIDDGNRGGGIIGLENFGGTVIECFVAGPITGGNGLFGTLNGDGEAIDSYWDIDVTGQQSSPGGGIGLQTAEMTGESASDSMTGFDFDSTWTTTDTYPALQWETQVEIADIEAPELVQAGDEFLVTVDMTNNTDAPTATELIFEFDSNEIETKELSLDPGATKSIEFSVETTDLDFGVYDYQLQMGNRTSSHTVTVVSDEDSHFEIVAVEFPSSIHKATDATLGVEIINNGVEDTQSVTALISESDGTTVESTTLDEVSLDPGDSVESTTDLDTSSLSPGEYELSVETDDNAIDTSFKIVTGSYVEFVDTPQSGQSTVTVSFRVSGDVDETARLRVGDDTDTEITDSPGTPRPGEEADEFELTLSRELDAREEITVVLQPSGGFDPAQQFDSDSVTITDPTPSPHFEITTLDVPNEVEEGTDATISAEVTNKGEEGDQDILINLRNSHGVEIDTETIAATTIDSDGSVDVSADLPTSALYPGEYTVSVETDDDIATADFEVVSESFVEFVTAPEAGDTEVMVNYRVSNSEDESLRLRVGDESETEITVSPVLPQPGDEEYDVSLTLGRELEAGEAVTVVLQPSGGYDPAEQIVSHTITVVESTDPDSDLVDESDDGMPGFGITSTIAGIGGLGYLINKRMNNHEPEEETDAK